MNRNRFIFNHIFRGPNGKGFNWDLFSVNWSDFRTIIALLTLGIMEGMEAQILIINLKIINVI